MSVLSEATRAADLPCIIERYFPDAGAIAGKAARVRPVWRGVTDFDASVYRTRGNVWRLHDFGCGFDCDAYEFLVEIVGVVPKIAAQRLILEAGLQNSRSGSNRPARAPGVQDTHPPDLNPELLASVWAHGQLGLDPCDVFTFEGCQNLEMLADFIAESIRPVLATQEPTLNPKGGRSWTHAV